MDMGRQDPDALLRAIDREESSRYKGKLKIFFGYSAGVGKTYAMLKAAQTAKSNGTDVVVGYVEPHARPETSALLEGLEVLPVLKLNQSGIEVIEFDLDGALKRKPKLILVDEYAHTNAAGSRHIKRYQDIEELLKAGIDVYTTVNVQHIESLNDTVASITGVFVRERIPDAVFDNANQVELVDIEPEELLNRFVAGNVYKNQQATRAMNNFFTLDNLTALREIALRRCADRVNLITESTKIKNNADYHTDEHILVCISSAPSNPKIVRTAARMAAAFKGNFTALFVETPSQAMMSEENKKRLRDNIHLAEQLGAKVETVYGEDVPYQIAEYARLSGISKIVIGRSSSNKRKLFGSPTLTERLSDIAPNIDIHIIPDASNNVYYNGDKKSNRLKLRISILDCLKSIGIFVITTLLGLVFYNVGFTEANIITVFILGVMIISVITSTKLYSIILSIVSVLTFNFFFTEPRYTFAVYDKGYPITFAVMFIATFITSSLAKRLKLQAQQSAQSAYRTKVLFDTNQLLQKATSDSEIMSITAKQLIKLLDRDIVIFPVENEELVLPVFFNVTDKKISMPENEKAVAEWVLRNNKHAGATTGTLNSAEYMYLSIRVNDVVYGVVGIRMDNIPLDSFENSVLLSILGECALALENSKNSREKEQAAIMAKNEQLRANLLRAISHDLRTPLTSISGNATNLISNGTSFDEATRLQMYTDIYDDSMWLINLVENLLSVTRIEEGRMNFNITTELVEDAIAEALKHINRKSVEHNICVKNTEELLLAKMDARLIVQVIINIVDNAIKYTEPGSDIIITTDKKDDMIVISIADNGPGIDDEGKKKVFDMFYCGSHKVADSRRSLGLGLSLCKSIINAHGGEIMVKDNTPKGAVFTFTLKSGEVTRYE